MRYEDMLKVETCANQRGKLTKSTPVLVAVYCAQYDYDEKDEFKCGWCPNNDLWTIPEILFSIEDNYFVTPCCHTEANAALVPENPQDEYDQGREDYESFVYAVTGR